MNIVVMLVSAILSYFPRLSNLQEMEEILDNSIVSKIVFPKDRPKSLSLRIIGGRNAIPNSYPFQVSVQVFITFRGRVNTSWCGGTLITPRWVLTAAHCVEDINTSHVVVRLGSHDLFVRESTRVVLVSTSFVLHEDWNTFTLQNDIALIRLPVKITLTHYINTVNYADADEDSVVHSYDGEVGTTIGWGVTQTGKISATLKQVNVSIMSNKRCARRFRLKILSSHLCTSGAGKVGTCVGDSGGPLLINGMQIGIVSFGPQDCNAGEPSVYTRVSHFSDWIARHVSGGCCILTNLLCTFVMTSTVCLLKWPNLLPLY